MPTIVTCRNCGKLLRVPDNSSSRSVCPHCLAALDISGEALVQRAPNVLRDVRRDSNAIAVMLWVLVALFAVGVVLAYTISYHNSGFDFGTEVGKMWYLLVAVGMLDFLVLVATTWSLFRSLFRTGSPVSAGRILGWVMGFLVLALGLVFALIILVCASCLSMVSGPQH